MARSQWNRLIGGGYRCVARAISKALAPAILARHPQWRWQQAIFEGLKQTGGVIPTRVGSDAQGSLIWFHAASAGELEMLWSVARAMRTLPEFVSARFALSVFSPSGATRLARFQTDFSTVYCGPSPWEGEWREFLGEMERRAGNIPSCFITAKYECWPELWDTLAMRGIPLFLVNAEWRSSLRWGSRLTRWIFKRLPRSYFFTVSPAACESISTVCGFAEARPSGDPRWDQVAQRLGRTHPRVEELRKLGENAALPRPWVVVGSAWKEDLETLLSASISGGFSGTFWVVPHRPSPAQCRDWWDRIEGFVPGAACLSMQQSIEEGLAPVQGTSARGSFRSLEDSSKAHPVNRPSFRVVLVQEMGILAELYGIGDAAWVGGGFRTGLHSVIEPALSELWIAAGAARSGKYPEVPELVHQKQLRLVDGVEAARRWLAEIRERPTDALRSEWRRWRSEVHLGASERIARRAAEIVSSSRRV